MPVNKNETNTTLSPDPHHYFGLAGAAAHAGETALADRLNEHGEALAHGGMVEERARIFTEGVQRVLQMGEKDAARYYNGELCFTDSGSKGMLDDRRGALIWDSVDPKIVRDVEDKVFGQLGIQEQASSTPFTPAEGENNEEERELVTDFGITLTELRDVVGTEDSRFVRVFARRTTQP